MINEFGLIEFVNFVIEWDFGYLLDEMFGKSVCILMFNLFVEELIGEGLKMRFKEIGLGCEVIGWKKDGGEFLIWVVVSEVVLGVVNVGWVLFFYMVLICDLI